MDSRRFRYHHRTLFILLASFILALSAGGCASLKDPEASQEYRSDVVATVRPGQVIGQTFISRRSRLDGVQIWLRPSAGAPPAGSVTFEVFHNPADQQPLVRLAYSSEVLTQSQPLNVPVPPQNDPPGQQYYLRMRTADTAFDVLGRSEDAYPYGQAYLNDHPLDADLSFWASYDYDPAAMLVDLRQGFSLLWLVLPLGLAFWVPGRLLLSWSGLEESLDGGQRLALSLGLSLSTIPVLMTWTSLLGLRWSRTAVWSGAILLLLVLLWRKRSSLHPKRWGSHLRRLVQPSSLVGAGLAAIFLISLGVRFAMIRDMAAPAWVDSVHHAMIIRLIGEQGAFPSSYAPYLDIETASYHAGYHADVAVFQWLSGLDIPQAMLILGQVLNALAVVAVYLLATTLVNDRLAGLIAALVAGLFTPMPAYYTSWGRYTQLTSLLILPAAMALIAMYLQEQAPVRRRLALLCGLAGAGMFLTHYRVVTFLALLVLVYLAGLPWRARRSDQPPASLLHKTGQLALVGALGILLSLPWWPATLRSLLIPKLAWGAGSPVAAFSDFIPGYLTSGLGQYTLTLALLGLAWGFIQRRVFALELVLWTGLMFILANLGVLNLPGNGFINNTSVEISLFMPISLLAGYLFSWVFTAWDRFLRGWIRMIYRTGLVAGGIVVALLGARSLLPILNPTTNLFHQEDLPAMAWIAANLPPGERVLINPFAWGYGLYAGYDGGFWISALAGHPTLPPPVLYGLANQREKIIQITQLSKQVTESAEDPAKLHQLMAQANIRYVYIGARGGALSPYALEYSPLFRRLYHVDSTWVFEALRDYISPQ